jgi:hypothetical protein
MVDTDLLYFIQPVVIILATSLLLVWYYRKKLLTSMILWFSLIAYFTAIISKEAIQLAVYAYGMTPSNPFVLGAYYGLQTVFLEVGLAYLFARNAFQKRLIRVEQAPAYGASLAFWENGVLLGILALPGLAVVIVGGGTGLSSGSLAYVLQSVALGTLERVSSILAHFSWGILTVVAVFTKKNKYLAVALPMGLIDFLVPFASSMNLLAFELMVFAFAALCLVVTYIMTKDEWPLFWGSQVGSPSAVEGAIPSIPISYGSASIPGSPGSEAPSNSNEEVHNARCPKCEAVFEAEWSPFLPHMGPLVLRKCPACGKRSFMESNVDSTLTWPIEDKRLH